MPPCYNRAPFADSHVRYALNVDNGEVERIELPRWFEQRCAVHDGTGIGPNGENYPQAHGWDCSGCRWEPK